mgnify:CR=1 FL=1
MSKFLTMNKTSGKIVEDRFEFIESRLTRLEVLIYIAIISNLPQLMGTVGAI